jgi:hypothetical protein
VQPSHHAAQELPFEKLHREKIDVSVPIQFVYVDDAFVGQSLSAIELASEVREQIAVIVRVRVQYFYRDVSIILGKIGAVAIQRLEHRALAAASQAFFENIPIS